MTADKTPSTYLFLSIAQTLLCCFPLGIYCIYLSTKVQDMINKGDIKEAQRLSKKVRIINICIICSIFIACAIFLLLGIILNILGIKNGYPHDYESVEKIVLTLHLA